VGQYVREPNGRRAYRHDAASYGVAKAYVRFQCLHDSASSQSCQVVNSGGEYNGTRTPVNLDPAIPDRGSLRRAAWEREVAGVRVPLSLSYLDTKGFKLSVKQVDRLGEIALLPPVDDALCRRN
jgi:hypothetical protein